MSRPKQPEGADACRWCDVGRFGHFQRYTTPVGWHKWTAPTDAQRLARLMTRRKEVATHAKSARPLP